MIQSLITNNCINTTDEIFKWIQQRNNDISVNVSPIAFSEMKGWYIDQEGCLKHESGRFFTIQGINVKTDYGKIPEWDQPIINQPEVGFLGIIAKKIKGILYFLMQAKIEPGNVNCVQISPTLQATKSNYSLVHKGKKPAYLEYFLNAKKENIILDQLQSEQGARFLRKRNRNIIILVNEDIEVFEDFRWMTLGQIKELMTFDNIVNMDTRTVLSGINFSNYITPLSDLKNMSKFGREMIKSAQIKEGFNQMNDLLSWLSGLKSKYDLYVSNKPIDNLKEWTRTEYEITNNKGKYFKVIGVKVSISNREVTSWCQPLVQPLQQGICAFIIKKIDGIYHFLVQAKLECGNYDVLELAPTVQSLTDNHLSYESKDRAPFTDYVINAPKENIIYDVLQSEEGGRFYKEQNRNMIVIADDSFPIDLPKRYIWMTLGQIYGFLKFNNYINIQARSLISAINYK